MTTSQNIVIKGWITSSLTTSSLKELTELIENEQGPVNFSQLIAELNFLLDEQN